MALYAIPFHALPCLADDVYFIQSNWLDVVHKFDWMPHSFFCDANTFPTGSIAQNSWSWPIWNFSMIRKLFRHLCDDHVIYVQHNLRVIFNTAHSSPRKKDWIEWKKKKSPAQDGKQWKKICEWIKRNQNSTKQCHSGAKLVEKYTRRMRELCS